MEEMDNQNFLAENKPTTITSLANLKDRFIAFINTPMDEHKASFKNTMDKVRSQISSRMSKDDAQEKVDEGKAVESHSPL
ncbi:unnamed protein product [Eruca vesicaria subsp. sativa]|uniref:Uncharacterized protein n=1 Tax=Eruca vesicaria subsp. sativa TaxID=29727 RepID=A0ABC8JYT9_ERUVS|nr:unnamed protein product [Eruca vesicaria subsp. sativa]